MGKVNKMLMERFTNFGWITMLAGNIAKPKALFCLWMDCHRRLSTKERLAKFVAKFDNGQHLLFL